MSWGGGFLLRCAKAAIQPIGHGAFRPSNRLCGQLDGARKLPLAHQIINRAAAQSGDVFNGAAAKVFLGHVGFSLYASVHHRTAGQPGA